MGNLGSPQPGSCRTSPFPSSPAPFYHLNLLFRCPESFDLSPFNSLVLSSPTHPVRPLPAHPSSSAPSPLRFGSLPFCSPPLHSIGGEGISCPKENEVVKDTTPDTRQMRLIAVYYSHIGSAWGRRALPVTQGRMGVTFNIRVNEQGLWKAGSVVEAQGWVTLGIHGNM